MAMSDLDKIQMGLAASGMVPGPTGIASDLADAGISLGRGDLLGALLAGGAAIPGIGMAFGARGARHLGKLGRGGGRSAMDVHDIVKARRARHGAEEADEARKWRNVEESEIENPDQFLHPEERELIQEINAGEELEESMTSGLALGREMDESLIAEIGDGLQKHGVGWKEAVGKGSAELKAKYESLMNSLEGADAAGLSNTVSYKRTMAKIEEILKREDSVAEFSLNRLDGQSFGESVENAVTTIQADIVRNTTGGVIPPGTAQKHFGGDLNEITLEGLPENDLIRQMTEGPEPNYRSSEMTTHEAMEQEAIDRYMQTGDPNVLPPGMRGQDVDAGYYPAAGMRRVKGLYPSAGNHPNPSSFSDHAPR